MSTEEELFKKDLQELALIIKASKGLPLDPDSVITQLTDIKNILERTRFPTYPILAKHVYFRLIAKYNKNAQACLDYSKIEASALISYKGQSRVETVEMNKAPQPTSQQFYLNDKRPPLEEEQKRHFWQKKPKEESEFNE
jgi:hypothetical protein